MEQVNTDVQERELAHSVKRFCFSHTDLCEMAVADDVCFKQANKSCIQTNIHTAKMNAELYIEDLTC